MQGFFGVLAVFYLIQLILATIRSLKHKPKTPEQIREQRENLVYTVQNFFSKDAVKQLNDAIRFGLTASRFIASIVYISLAFNGPFMWAGLALGVVSLVHSIAYYKMTVDIETEAWFQTSKWEKAYFAFHAIVGIPYLSYWLYSHIWPG